MIDFGFDKIALIGAVALIVIGPQKLPRVARTVGHLIGKAQRYVADVKAEVNRSIELEELQKMKSQFETAASDIQSSVSREINEAKSGFESSWSEATAGLESSAMGSSEASTAGELLAPPPLAYKRPNKRWRLKRTAMPQWYKQRQGIRTRALSGAARVARFRPPRVK
ncbi:MAG: Sec-independent protein translocase subunit TatB [Burkholderiaceae bacterium]|jgi:sec-independent protein translocase protein TatB|nr:Sec-independent protein translocase subunit TatB [Burkholderiaceae bacterium]